MLPFIFVKGGLNEKNRCSICPPALHVVAVKGGSAFLISGSGIIYFNDWNKSFQFVGRNCHTRIRLWFWLVTVRPERHKLCYVISVWKGQHPAPADSAGVPLCMVAQEKKASVFVPLQKPPNYMQSKFSQLIRIHIKSCFIYWEIHQCLQFVVLQKALATFLWSFYCMFMRQLCNKQLQTEEYSCLYPCNEWKAKLLKAPLHAATG